MPTAITIEAPRQDELLDLLRQSDEYAAALYPPESCYMLNIAELEAPNVAVFVARLAPADPAPADSDSLPVQGDDAGTRSPLNPAVAAATATATAPAVGIAALVLNPDGTAELKRVFVTATARGRGVARGILRSVEEFARSRDVRAVLLETGPAQPEAIALYETHGYEHIPQFGQYVGDELSVCMSKTLR